jgi:TonB family protein
MFTNHPPFQRLISTKTAIIALVLSMLMPTLHAQDKDSVKSTQHIFIEEPAPTYPGGHSETIKFIKKHLKQPTKSNSNQGKVYIGFVVNADGSLANLTVMRGLGAPFDGIALEIVKKMPNWIPAR